MTSQTPAAMPDVQAMDDRRKIAIDKVGVKAVTYPIILRTPEGGAQTTVANINMYVSLPHCQKGTHMSRFLEVLNEHNSEPVHPEDIPTIARVIKERLEAEDAYLELEFTYFIRKQAPVTKMSGLMDYRVTFAVHSNSHDDFVMGVRAPATSLCPCSKEISDRGAHNQRCEIEARVRFKGSLWIEDLARMIEKSASTEVFAVLKRPDEKFVTEQAYDNPKFVEDIVRDLAMRLDADERILQYTITSENFESIHNHSAYAQISRDKRSPGGA
ncbi:MAG: GTP cyclohydrolase I FolE2 [Phycisphaerales bacterium]|nr:MAG: GTP cyclohydrolase I FolE2 [Phycisphaerales bacterium]